jgi:hypothetical protein
MQRLPNVHPSDLTKFPNGNGAIQLNASNDGSKILMYNETPLNIDLDFLNGKSDVLHAWEANFWTLDGDTKEVDWMIDVDSLNVVNPPINAIFLTLYDPTEKLNDKAYPMPLIRQVGGQVAVTGATNTLTNEVNAAGSEVIDIGTIANQKLIDIFTDHFKWSVEQAGIAHQVLKGQTAGSPLQIGQTGDISEVLGNLLIDGGKIGKVAIGDTLDASDGQNLVLNALLGVVGFSNTGSIKFMAGLTELFEMYQQWNGYANFYSPTGKWVFSDISGNFPFASDGSGSAYFEALAGQAMHFRSPHNVDVMIISSTLAHILQALQVDGACTFNGVVKTNLILDNVTGQTAIDLSAGTGAVKIPADQLVGSTGQKILDGSGHTDLFINPVATGAGHKISFATNATERATIDDTGINLKSGAINFLTGSITRKQQNTNAVCGAGTTITHGLGATPHMCVCTPNIAQPGSATVGISTPGSTTFVVTVGAGSAVSFGLWAN